MQRKTVTIWWVIGTLTGLVLAMRWFLAYGGWFPFSWDFSRDMLWLRQMTILHKPMLVGAWGSLQGSYFGAGYFYLLLIPALISGGDPRAAVMLVSLLLTGLIPLAYWVGQRQINPKVGLLWAFLLALSPYLWQLALYSFPQQIIPLLFFCFLVAEWQMWQHHSWLWAAIGTLLASLFIHFEPADLPLAYLSWLSLLGLLLYQRKLTISRTLVVSLFVGGVIPLLGNGLFDLRHGFTQIKALGQIVSGADQSLGGGLPFGARLIDRPEQFLRVLWQTLVNRWTAMGIALIIILIVWLWLKRPRQHAHFGSAEVIWLKLLLANLGLALGYFIIFPRLLKDYYLYFLPIVFLLLLGILLARVLQEQVAGKWIAGLFLAVLAGATGNYILNQAMMPTGQTYRIQKEVVDAIYTDAHGTPMRIYTYTPLIYDYPYQYLFAWYGQRRWGYLPVEYAYKPNQPEYVQDKSLYDTGSRRSLRESQKELTYLIAEPDDQPAYSRNDWLANAKAGREFQESRFPGNISLFSQKIKWWVSTPRG